MSDELKEGEFYTLTDEDGNDVDFELIATCELGGVEYFAMIAEDEDEEYVILKKITDDDGEEILVTIDDDEEFDRVADHFDEHFASESEVDHDA